MIKYSLCVSGAAGGPVVDQSKDKAYQLGAAIARAGHVLTTGATVGLPFFAAQGAKDEGGLSIGFSPAANLREHVAKYRFPVGVFDYINFTGMDMVHRDVHLVTSSDAVLTVGGRTGSLHEFTNALESAIPCGSLIGSGGAADIIPDIVERLGLPKNGQVVLFDSDPERLVAKMIAQLDADYADLSEAEIAAHEETFKDLANRLGSRRGV